MPAGRPSQYTPDMIAKFDEYLKTWNVGGDVIPTVEGLACFVDMSVKQIYEWNKDDRKAEISKTLEQIKKEQKKILMNKGLLGDFNSNITKLLLHQHGLNDKTDVDVTSAGEAIAININFKGSDETD